MTAINWNASKEDIDIIFAIVDRAIESIKKNTGRELDRVSLAMDLTATHLNGTPLRLADLLAADEYNFAHDVVGIINNMNRRTGKPENCFLPRFAA